MKRRRTPEDTRARILTLGLHALSAHPGRTWALTMTARTAGVWVQAQLQDQGLSTASGESVLEPALAGHFVLRVSPIADAEVIAVPLDRRRPRPPSYRLDLTTGAIGVHAPSRVVVPLPRRASTLS
ncbi:hypothetical protein NOCA2300049 [metagenome]|uniref:Uncharacterized protein n=1 Tax=metagenome TaxID=256318 RepID=A0A2P2C1C4_9ZZZZ